jgi:hypothetical protein
VANRPRQERNDLDGTSVIIVGAIGYESAVVAAESLAIRSTNART